MSYDRPHFIDKKTKQPVFFSDIRTWSVHRFNNMSGMTLLIILLAGVCSGGIALLLLFCFKENQVINLTLNNGEHMSFTMDNEIFKQLVQSDRWHSSSSVLNYELVQDINKGL